MHSEVCLEVYLEVYLWSKLQDRLQLTLQLRLVAFVLSRHFVIGIALVLVLECMHFFMLSKSSLKWSVVTVALYVSYFVPTLGPSKHEAEERS